MILPSSVVTTLMSINNQASLCAPLDSSLYTNTFGHIKANDLKNKVKMLQKEQYKTKPMIHLIYFTQYQNL